MKKLILISLVGLWIAGIGCEQYHYESPSYESPSYESPAYDENTKKLSDLIAQKVFGVDKENDKTEHAGPKNIPDSALEQYCAKITPVITKAITPSDRNVRNLAVSAASHSPGQYNIWQVCMIWYGLKNTWSYVNDPRGNEYVATAGESALLLAGDCDDFAILMASMVEAVGGSSRIVAAQSEKSGHMFSEVFLASTKINADSLISDINKLDQKRSSKAKAFYYRKDSEGFWLNLDWFAEYPGGPYFPSTFEVLIYPDGKCVKNVLNQ